MLSAGDSVGTIAGAGAPTVNTVDSPGRNWALLIFVVLSMLVQISLGQEDQVEVNSRIYWLLVAPALIFPLFNIRQILVGLVTPLARLLLAFAVFAGTWHLLRGDIRAVSQLILLVWVAAWVAGSEKPFFIGDLVKLYIGLILIGIFISLYTSLNVWGLLPGVTRHDYGIWRVSFFPNIANTGILSLFMLFLLTRDRMTVIRHPIALVICLYFLICSFVRTAQIAAGIYLLMRFWYWHALERQASEKNKKKYYFVSAIAVTIIAHLVIAVSPYFLSLAQDIPFVSRMFLRGENGLTVDEIYTQAYRPWLWWQHISLLGSSTGLMGLGVFEFDEVIDQALVFDLVDKGSESLPTRLLASYGVAAIFFIGFIIAGLKRRAESADGWACACFPSIFLLMMGWGSVFHPTNAFFVLFFFILLHGSDGFSERTPRPPADITLFFYAKA